MATIRFLKPWQRRPRGHLDSQLPLGVQDVLVRRSIAEWVEERVAQTSPPETEPAPQQSPRKTGRKALPLPEVRDAIQT